tara:strand:+ start:807 stop:1076 length:270 start_codon:yes stop_codon:yes gene_type:complete
MKISVELFGAARDLSSKDFINFELVKNSSIKDLRNQLLRFVDSDFNGNETFKKIINSSSFCSDEDKIVSDNFKIEKTQRFSIIPPIGGG